MSMIGQPRIVTQDMQIRFHGPARPGLIVAEADVIHFGQRTITTQCLVKQGEAIIASVTATFAILSDREIEAVRNGPG